MGVYPNTKPNIFLHATEVVYMHELKGLYCVKHVYNWLVLLTVVENM